MNAHGSGDIFLLLSGGTADEERLIDQEHLRAVLRRMPALIGMNVLREPVISVATNNPGLEGYVPVDMSNITISTYTNDPRVLVCVHSCQPFETGLLIDFVRTSFRCTGIRSLLVKEAEFGDIFGASSPIRKYPVGL